MVAKVTFLTVVRNVTHSLDSKVARRLERFICATLRAVSLCPCLFTIMNHADFVRDIYLIAFLCPMWTFCEINDFRSATVYDVVGFAPNPTVCASFTNEASAVRVATQDMHYILDQARILM